MDTVLIKKIKGRSHGRGSWLAENTIDIDAEAGERLLKIEQVAERLQYSAQWVRDQVKSGRIPVIAFNSRAWRFHWPTVIAALQKL